MHELIIKITSLCMGIVLIYIPGFAIECLLRICPNCIGSMDLVEPSLPPVRSLQSLAVAHHPPPLKLNYQKKKK